MADYESDLDQAITDTIDNFDKTMTHEQMFNELMQALSENIGGILPDRRQRGHPGQRLYFHRTDQEHRPVPVERRHLQKTGGFCQVL